MSKQAQMDALYAELPTIECKGLCGDTCHFIGMTRLEHGRIRRATGHDIRMEQSPCPALDFMGRCAVYTLRPLICRLWGVVDVLPCHYGCKPSPRYLTYEEGKVFILRARDISGDNSLYGVKL